MLLGNFKVGKSAPLPSQEKFTLSLLLSRPWHLGKSLHRLLVGKSPHRHCYCHVRDITPPLQATNSHELLYLSYKKQRLKIYYKKSMWYLHGYSLIWWWCWSRRVGFKYLWHLVLSSIDDEIFWSFWER
jgi:hypothetical protein